MLRIFFRQIHFELYKTQMNAGLLVGDLQTMYFSSILVYHIHRMPPITGKKTVRKLQQETGKIRFAIFEAQDNLKVLPKAAAKIICTN